MLNEILRLLPQSVQAAVSDVPAAQLEELRLRVGQKPSAVLAGEERTLSAGRALTQAELQQTLLNASAQSQYAVQEQLRSGYLGLPGGYRVGVCGSVVVQDGRVCAIREISSLALRIPHEARDSPERLLPYLREDCLLAGAPGSGKTTLLRRCIRALSESGQRVGVVDERLELAGAVGGRPQFELGPRTDVLSGCPKAAGLLMLLRSMSPQWLAVDELMQPEEAAALRQAAGSGVRLLATVHAGSVEELRRKPVCRELLADGIFKQVLYLDKNRAFHAERIQYAKTDRTWTDPDGFGGGRHRTGRDGEAAADPDGRDDRCAAAHPA